MKIERIDIFALHIPFRFSFDHSVATRGACDSIILRITSDGISGYGETIVREYVSSASTDPERIALSVSDYITTVLDGHISLERLQALAKRVVGDGELPILCALETAGLDLLCRVNRCDIYDLLGLPPLRRQITYGGVVPILPKTKLAEFLNMYRSLGVRSIRLKINADPDYAESTLSLSRTILGSEADLRVDVNGGWNADDAEVIIPILQQYDVAMIEEPLGRSQTIPPYRADSFKDRGTIFVADESFRTLEELDRCASDGFFDMLNIRLAKNGGILRSIACAERAEELGMLYQLGCHVGETGILSAAGRVAAALLKSPVYVDGSYDRYLLTDNITEEDFSFGAGATAPVVRNNGIGYTVDLHTLERCSEDVVTLEGSRIYGSTETPGLKSPSAHYADEGIT